MSLLSFLTRRITLMDGLKLHNGYRRIYNITLTVHEATKSIIINIYHCILICSAWAADKNEILT